jgi:Uma2 family endonuclease
LPIALIESEPEPDAAVVRGDITTYFTRHPTPTDFGIVIEISDSTLAFDRRDKGRIYARAGIPVYWIVNVVDRQVEVYTDPQPGAAPPAYAAQTIYRPGQDVPILLDGTATSAVAVSDLLP